MKKKTKIEELEIGDMILAQYGHDYYKFEVIAINKYNVPVIETGFFPIRTTLDSYRAAEGWSHIGRTLRKRIRDWFKELSDKEKGL